MEGQAATAAPEALGADAVRLLQRLIRADTVNPPGNERAAQLELMDLLSGAGFECELLAAEPERPNLVAALRGRSDGPTLTLLGHIDTVRADPGEWSRDPWGGDLADGLVWGRGAVDMKGQVAAEVAGAAALAAGGWRPPAGSLMVVVTADEEAGGELGARWLCERHPDKVRTDMVVNEGGGRAIEDGPGRRLYTLSVGEKGVCRFLLRTRGTAGHSSQPAIGDNALLKLAPHLARLRRQPPAEPRPEGLRFLSVMLDEEVDPAGLEAALDRLRESHPELTGYLAEPMLGVTLAPTRISASEKANVIPSVAEALIDCRVPPGYGKREVRERVAALLDGDDYEIEFTETVMGTTSELETPLAEAIADWVAETDPGAGIAPTVMAGFSDSNWFRGAFGEAAVYGFFPQREMGEIDSAPLMHSADERIPVSDVALASRFFWDLPQRVLA